MSDWRLPAEWEPYRAVMLAWPHVGTDWADMLEQVQEVYLNIMAALEDEVKVVMVGPGQKYDIPTNDTWTRDYGPITVFQGGRKKLWLDFKFNGWGLKFPANLDNQVTRRLAPRLRAKMEGRQWMVLEGGSIESDGQGVIMTTSSCLLSPNRNPQLTRMDIEELFSQMFGTRRVLWLEHGEIPGDDTDGHIDTLARFAPGNVILYAGGCETEMLEDLKGFRTLDDEPYDLRELPCSEQMFDPEGNPMPATYANFLITPRSVLVPTYGQPEKDDAALKIIAEAFPGSTVKGIDCRPLIRQHGSLHCATMQLY